MCTYESGEQGAIYIDLGDPSWRAVVITSSGWSVVDEHPVRFRRTRGMAALPIPVRGGELSDLWPFLNLGSDDDWRLAVGYLLAAARPPGRLVFCGSAADVDDDPAVPERDDRRVAMVVFLLGDRRSFGLEGEGQPGCGVGWEQ